MSSLRNLEQTYNRLQSEADRITRDWFSSNTLSDTSVLSAVNSANNAKKLYFEALEKKNAEMSYHPYILIFVTCVPYNDRTFKSIFGPDAGFLSQATEDTLAVEFISGVLNSASRELLLKYGYDEENPHVRRAFSLGETSFSLISSSGNDSSKTFCYKIELDILLLAIDYMERTLARVSSVSPIDLQYSQYCENILNSYTALLDNSKPF